MKNIKLFSYKDFNVAQLVALKKSNNITISVVIPTLNEEAHVGALIDVLQKDLIHKALLIDELVVLDSGSTDKTKEEVEKRNAKFYYSKDILSNYGNARGKGENLWKSLYVTSGDIIVWIDADSANPDPAYVYGLVGPLLTNNRIKFTKAFFTRFTHHDGNGIPAKPNGGRVTEILGRPLINLLFPEISGIFQPFNGNVAGKREVFESISIPSAYGIETSVLIDITLKYGVESLAQVYCKSFEQDGQDLQSLGKMGFQALRVSLYKAQEHGRLSLNTPLPTLLKQLDVDVKGSFKWKSVELKEIIRPPFRSLFNLKKYSNFKNEAPGGVQFLNG